jgi:hypothetical protein
MYVYYKVTIWCKIVQFKMALQIWMNFSYLIKYYFSMGKIDNEACELLQLINPSGQIHFMDNLRKMSNNWLFNFADNCLQITNFRITLEEKCDIINNYIFIINNYNTILFKQPVSCNYLSVECDKKPCKCVCL